MSSLPSNILKYFWGDKLEDLSWEQHKDYIAKTILEKGDKNSVGWLLEKVDKNYIKRLINTQKLDSKSKNFWRIYLS